MNDIYKTNIKDRLDKAMESEGLRPSETARIFGFHPNYISMMRNPDTWIKCPKSAWETVSLWINSGQSLKEYSEKHGRVIPQEQKVTDKPVTKVETPEPVLRDFTQLNSTSIHITPGIRQELIKELQLRGDQLRDELMAITKLLEQYI